MTMVNFQLPLLGLARDFNSLTAEEKDFIHYFSTIDYNCIASVLDCYKGIGPKGYGTALILSRIIKIKQRILSDRQLTKAIRQNDLYRFVTSNIQPSHNTFTALRKRLGPSGFAAIHKRFVTKAHSLGLLDIDIPKLPRTRRKGIILIADSTFLINAGSTRGTKDEQGKWQFTDESVSFTGKAHHKHKYPFGHKAHSLRTISGMSREHFEIIPSIIRKKMVYRRGFTEGGYPLCPLGFSMKPKGIDYAERRTKYACFKACTQSAQQQLPLPCVQVKEQSRFGYTYYTYFAHGYRKYGPALPHQLFIRNSSRSGLALREPLAW
jgi:hypothetical protein